jgi:membrane protein
MQAIHAIAALLRETLAEWTEDKASRLGAAVAYYTIFSIAPVLFIAVVIAGVVFGQAEAQNRIVSQVSTVIGAQGAEAIGRMIESAKLPRDAGIAATVIGVVSLLAGAVGAFSQLQDAFDTIWEVTPRPGKGAIRLLKTRLLSFAMVLVVGFLLLASLIINTVLAAISGHLENRLPNFALLAAAINVLLPLVVTTVLFALMFKVLPDVHLSWRDIWLGAFITAVLFTVGKAIIGFYLGNSRLGTAYGAAGSVLIILAWIYYSAQILLFGAEFTQVYVRRYGRQRVVPTENAVPVTEAARLHQGLPRTTAVPAPNPVPPHSRSLVRQRHPRSGRDYAGPLLGFAAGLSAGVMVALRALRQGPE